MGQLGPRVGQAQRDVEEACLRRMAAADGCSFEEFRQEVSALVPRMRAWRAEGLTGREVLERIVREVAEADGGAFTEDEVRAAVDEAERFCREGIPS